MGDDIFEIFTEEVTEITQNLGELIPQWVQNRQDRECLGEIRRGFHTLKGSGRMAGAFALGDFAWAHENLLNQVMAGQVASNDAVAAQLQTAAQELQERLAFFHTAQHKDNRVETAIARVEAILAGKPVTDSTPEPTIMAALPELSFDGPETTELPAISPEALETAELQTITFDAQETPERPFTVSDEPETDGLDAPTITPPQPEADTQLILQLFWEEFPDQIAALDQHIQTLQTDPNNRDTIRELEREFHTLKGGARMAQLTQLADISHDAETLLSTLPHQQGADAATLDALQQAIDKLHTLAEQEQRSKPTPLPAVTALVPQTSTVESAAATIAETAAPPNTPSAPEHLPINTWTTPSTDMGSLLEQMLAEQAHNLPPIHTLGTGSRPDKLPVTNTDPNAQGNNHDTIRLPALFIDNLIERVVGLNVQQVRLSEHFNSMGIDVEELGRTVARLRQQVRTLELESEAQIHDGRDARHQAAANHDNTFDPLELDQYAEIQRISRSLAESLNDLVNLEADLSAQVRKGEQLLQEDMRTTRHVQQDLLDTRLVALTMLVPRLRRLTRQTASELGKQVGLEVEGEECELDRNLLQNMTAPLEHLIRNAISHGIEPPEEREQQGKARSGRITLSVSRDDAEIIIRFHDDGRGLDREQLRQRGVELGFLRTQDNLPDSEVDRLILRPGFSTAKTISQIAGRGIGMDIVHSELKALGGSLQIESQAGQGTTFIMRLPFTLIVNPVLLVEVENQMFALPISGIQGLARLSGADITKAQQDGGSPLNFAGETYHLHTLAEALGSGHPPPFAEDEMFPVVFYKLQEHTLAWVIGHIHGRREVVLQPLGVLFKNCRLYSAATVSPDGRVFLVPDMTELARRYQTAVETVPANNVPSIPIPDTTAAGTARIMVVDDSITVRRVTEKFLQAQDYTVNSAKDGMEALEKIGDFLPNAVLLDIEMPRMDGFELLGHLRRDPQWQKLPVIMISSRTAQRHREHAMSLGATAFLGKPYQNEILLNTLQQVLATGHTKEHVST